jgi:hypothetical protein
LKIILFRFKVRSQLSKLWSPVCLRVFVAPLLEIVSKLPELPAPSAVPTFYEPDEVLPESSTVAATAGSAAKQVCLNHNFHDESITFQDFKKRVKDSNSVVYPHPAHASYVNALAIGYSIQASSWSTVHLQILKSIKLFYFIFFQFFMKAVDRTKSTLHSASSASRSVSAGSSGRNPVSVKLGSPECMKAALVCSMFQSALQTLSQLRLEILAGLCYQVIFFVFVKFLDC